jgi:uncharacterized protein YlaI
MNRSGKQKCPICKRSEILVEHHIEGRNIPNANHPSNLAYICPNDHQRIHEGLIVIERYVRTSGGLELLWHEASEESFTGEDAKPYII